MMKRQFIGRSALQKKRTAAVACGVFFGLSTLLCQPLFVEAKERVSAITESAAIKIALKKAGGGVVVKCELEQEKVGQVFEIEIINGNVESTMDIGVADSAVYNYEYKTIRTNANNTITASDLTIDKAKQIALKKTNGGTIVKWDLDYERGKKVYEMEIVNGDTKYNLDVSTTNGKIYNYKHRKITSKTRPIPTSIPITKGEITAAQAEKIAIEKAGGGTVVRCELDYENGMKVYEIEIIRDNTKYELDIAAADGTIRDYEEEMVSNITNPTLEYITVEKAKEIALAQTGGGTVMKCHLDYEDMVYEVEIRDGRVEYDLEINAKNGMVVEFEHDYDD